METLEADPDLDLLRVAARVELVQKSEGWDSARSAALSTLGWIRVEHVTSHGSELARRAALFLCLFWQDPAAAHVVGNVLRYDRSQVVRRDAAQRLAMMNIPAASAELMWALGCESDPEIREAAAMALRHAATFDDIGPLWRALDDEDPVVAKAADEALERVFGESIQG